MLKAAFAFQEFASSKISLFFKFEDIPPFSLMLIAAQFMSSLFNLHYRFVLICGFFL